MEAVIIDQTSNLFVFRNLCHSSPTPFQITLDSSQVRMETLSSEDPTPRFQEDVLSRKMTSKRAMKDLRAPSKFQITTHFFF
jgi:hypothetical protein